MERLRLIPQIYGYAVCLVCVITVLIASSRLIDGLFDTVTPEMSREVEMSLGGSFEMYKERRAERTMRRAPTEQPQAVPQPADSVLRRLYEDERRTRISFVRYHGLRRLVGSTLLLLLAGGFFLWHWRWLRRGETAAA